METPDKIDRTYDSLTAMIRWEDGALSDSETVKLFQYLVDTGLAWQLQGMYGRQARDLINAGLVHIKGH